MNCSHCGGRYLDDGDEERCINCGRPRVGPPTPALRLIRSEAADMSFVIEREIKKLAAERAAGERIWS